MSEHTMKLLWEKESEEFTYQTYNRSHVWDFGHENIVEASSAPAYLGDEELVDPEQAFVASVASCHMLTFLAVAAKKGLIVERYEDDPVGILGKNDEGKMAMTEITLHPKITFGKEQPSQETLNKIHEKAHHACFIANSVTTKITIESI